MAMEVGEIDPFILISWMIRPLLRLKSITYPLANAPCQSDTRRIVPHVGQEKKLSVRSSISAQECTNRKQEGKEGEIVHTKSRLLFMGWKRTAKLGEWVRAFSFAKRTRIHTPLQNGSESSPHHKRRNQLYMSWKGSQVHIHREKGRTSCAANETKKTGAEKTSCGTMYSKKSNEKNGSEVTPNK